MSAIEPPPQIAPNLPPDFLARIREKFARFVKRFAPAEGTNAAPLLVLCHSDADGLAAGAIITRALRWRGKLAQVMATGKGGNVWAPDFRAELAARAPSALIVCDLGLRAEPVLEGVPTFFIDHHRPTGRPADEADTVVTGYGMEPTPTSGLLAHECTLDAQSDSDSNGSDWVAAISILSDLGDKSPFVAFVARAKKAYGAGVLRDATSLLNAPRRSASGDASAALALLVEAKHPREIISGDRPEVAALQRDKEEVNAAYAEAKKAGPKFAGQAAMIRIHTPCQVHPLIAQIWRTRLPKFIVFGVNTGYRPGWVHFSGRCGKILICSTSCANTGPPGRTICTTATATTKQAAARCHFRMNEWVRGLGFGPEMLAAADGSQPEAELCFFAHE